MKKILMLFLSVFFWGCTSSSEIVPVKLQMEELEVIKQTFPNNDFFSWRLVEAPKFPPKVWHQNKKEKERPKRLNDSIYRNQFKKQIWFVTDTLFNPTNFSSGNKFYFDPRIKLDTIFFNLEKKLFTPVYPKQAAKLNGLVFKDYLFASIDSIKKLNKIPKRYIAITRVVLNPEHTKACYYVSYSFPENHAGSGEMLYAEKKFGKWYLIYRRPYWTS